MTNNELIYYYKENLNKNAFWILYNKYYEKLLLMILKKYKQQFHNLPFEKGDLANLVSTSLFSSIKEFDLNQNKYNFEQFCCTKVKSLVFYQIKKYLSLSHKVLNCSTNLLKAFEVQDISEENKNEIFEEEKQITQKAHFCKKIILNTLNKSKDKNLIKIMELKFKGYKNNQIMKILDIKGERYISNKIYFFSKKIRNKHCLKNKK